MLLDELPRLGLTDMHPVDGAFYVYADVARLHERFDRVLPGACWRRPASRRRPGVDFDPIEGAHYLRFSFAGSEDDCREAVRRLAGWLR